MSKITSKTKAPEPPVTDSPVANQPNKQKRTKSSSRNPREVKLIQEYNNSSHKPGAIRIRYEVPEVAKHCARVVIMHNMDFDAAASYLVGGRQVDPSQLSGIAHSLEHNEFMKSAIEHELTVHGLDDNSKESYVKELWEWFRYGSENKAMKAAGILGRGFIAEKVESAKPEELPLQGLGDAVKSMLGGPTDDADVKEPEPTKVQDRAGRSVDHGDDQELTEHSSDGRGTGTEATGKKLLVRHEQPV